MKHNQYASDFEMHFNRKGKTNRNIDLNYEPELTYFSEWWKQLLVNQKEKTKKYFPRSAKLLLWFYIQSDKPFKMDKEIFLKTIIKVNKAKHTLVIPNYDWMI